MEVLHPRERKRGDNPIAFTFSPGLILNLEARAIVETHGKDFQILKSKSYPWYFLKHFLISVQSSRKRLKKRERIFNSMKSPYFFASSQAESSTVNISLIKDKKIQGISLITSRYLCIHTEIKKSDRMISDFVTRAQRPLSYE